MGDGTDCTAAFAGSQEGSGRQADVLCVPEWQRSDWEALFAHTTPVHIGAGVVLIQKDASERSLYFVCSGMLEVTSVLGAHSLGLLRRIGPRSVVGELAFFDSRPRSAKVWAVRDSDLRRLDFRDYERFAATDPARACALLFGLGSLVATRLRHTMMPSGTRA
jgi:CRP-like cAMP-binding protein